MTRLRCATPWQALVLFCAFAFLPLLSACSGVTGQVQETLSGALAPVTGAIDEAARRAGDVGEGINQVTDGIGKVRGAFSGSGTTW
jgi:hypothetical protein